MLLGAKMQGANFLHADIKDATFTVDDTTRKLFQGLPAFTEHLNNLADVDRIVAAHEQWVDSQGQSGTRADFTGRSMKGVDLRGRELSTVSFLGADLSGAQLSHAKLAVCDFSKANLSYTDLSGADLRGVGLEGAILRNTVLEAANLTDLLLRGGGTLPVRLHGATIEWVDFTDTMINADALKGLALRDCQLPPASAL